MALLLGFEVTRDKKSIDFHFIVVPFQDPREDPKSRSLTGGSYKVPLVV